MPWLPSTCSSRAITRSIGTSGRPCAGGSRPTCTCRPRGRRLRIEFVQVTGGAERVERDVRSPAGQLGDRRRHVPGAVHGVLGAELPGEVERAGRDVDRDRPGHRRAAAICTAESPTPPQPCTATHSPARTRADVHDRPEGRGVAAAQRGGRGQVQLLGDGDEVDVGGVEGDELRERAPVSEAGLGLPGAHLLLAGGALRAACRRR